MSRNKVGREFTIPLLQVRELARTLSFTPGQPGFERCTPRKKDLELEVAPHPFSLFRKDLLKGVDFHSLEYPIDSVGIGSCESFRFKQGLCGNNDKASRAIGERTGKDDPSFGIHRVYSL